MKNGPKIGNFNGNCFFNFLLWNVTGLELVDSLLVRDMVRAWLNTPLARIGALGLAQMGKNGEILGLKNQQKSEKKLEIFFLIFFNFNG